MLSVYMVELLAYKAAIAVVTKFIHIQPLGYPSPVFH